eukprot:CAMPEP_0202969004 /NCGR_PEP_ID=MMETSP1396-20130829/14595_1 /ASSEMBLY_ACC=CAM_ASM_000872 /TAXON_ID= /ORGANISM="Pseudokeronopsis sp., Strain Brazil" /LENGTH=351 /DNA_ID=CAMNT_0049696053 /DNA_START=12 /DNA_END=1064 /DNA_ORIENTATION=-
MTSYEISRPDKSGGYTAEHKSGSTEKSSASGIFKTPDGKTIEIRDVWASNLDVEMALIRELVVKYKYVAMDTEFPGVVARPVGDVGDMQYQTLRCNVDMLKLIQLGICLTDEEGNWVDGCTCWQFNFKFSLSDDIFAQDSIELLKTSGIDFEKFEKFGIDVQYFGEIMMMSGLVLNDDIKWISFHSKYDFGYLLKTLTCAELPMDEQGFLDLLFTYFPCIYDVKYMMTLTDGMHGGLEALAIALQLDRIGPMHQAGSDSLMTAQTFFGLIKKNFGGVCDDSRFKGELYGVGTNHTKHKIKYPSTTSLNGMAQTGYPTLQYNSAVHYPPNLSSSMMHSAAAAANNFGYEEGY